MESVEDGPVRPFDEVSVDSLIEAGALVMCQCEGLGKVSAEFEGCSFCNDTGLIRRELAGVIWVLALLKPETTDLIDARGIIEVACEKYRQG